MLSESARVTAIGRNNYIAKPGDPHGLSCNPASLAAHHEKTLFGTFENRFTGEMLSGTTALALKHLGIQIDYLNISDFEKRDDAGQLVDNFSFNQIDIAAAWGFEINKNIALGLGLNMLSKFVDNKSNWGMSIDVGMIYKLHPQLHMGALLENLGSETSLNKSSSSSASIPALRLGTAWSPLDQMDVFGGISFSSQPIFNFNCGIELKPFDWFSFRLGFDSAYRSYGMLRTGIGLKIAKTEVDYAFKAHKELGISQVISLSYKFSPTKIKTSKPIIEKVEPTQDLPQKEEQNENKFYKLNMGIIYFAIGKHKISTEDPAAQEMAKLIKCLYDAGLYIEGKDGLEVYIEGSASPSGDEEENLKLSAERVSAGTEFVRDTLQIKKVDPKLLIKGSIVDIPKEEKERAQNCKISFKIDLDVWIQKREEQEIQDCLGKERVDELNDAYENYINPQEPPEPVTK